ncbi:MAG TPA: glycosyltransferase family 2 protein [Chitinophagaceae bacterium]
MLLSIIIVNYNVKFFLEQCLCSVRKALDFGAALNRQEASFGEVIVVDNHSTDGSIEYLKPRFPFVKFIGNKENRGFSRANNQALSQASGKYILFLNPDTILPEDVFQKTISFLEANPDAGLLGIRMVDGSGNFLKESKRGMPTPWASFCKMSGLTALFPTSKLFARYYLGHLNERETLRADVLAGAFMLAPANLLKEVGGFDEQFFMYAEDIDLSYRVSQTGRSNYYFTGATIIHFKGESTRKDAGYVKLFYKAMRQFVKKHYRSGSGLIFSGMLTTAIRLRSVASVIRGSAIMPKVLPIEDATLRGDEETVKLLGQSLRKRNIEIKGNSSNIIYCEGKNYSFHHIIEAIQQMNSMENALIHASGSNSIVGSGNKDHQGMAFEI